MGKNCLYLSDFVDASELTLKHVVALETLVLGWITPPPPPQLSERVQNLMSTYSDPRSLSNLLRLPESTTAGWDARYVIALFHNLTA